MKLGDDGEAWLSSVERNSSAHQMQVLHTQAGQAFFYKRDVLVEVIREIEMRFAGFRVHDGKNDYVDMIRLTD